MLSTALVLWVRFS